MYDPMYLRCCSLDGDADRLVYHTTNAKGEPVLLDGDKIGILYSKAIAKLLEDIIGVYPSVRFELTRYKYMMVDPSGSQ